MEIAVTPASASRRASSGLPSGSRKETRIVPLPRAATSASAGEELLARVKQLAADNKVKRVRIVEPDGDIALEIPLTYGAIAGGAVVLAAPVLAVLGTLGALAARFRLEIVNEATEDEATDAGA